MGADLIVAVCDYPTVPASELHARIDALPDSTLADCVESLTGQAVEVGDPDSESFTDEELFGPWRDVMRDNLHRIVNDWFPEELPEPNLGRGAMDLFIGGRHVILSGGMSYGDSPEGCDDLWLLEASGICTTKWERDDIQFARLLSEIAATHDHDRLDIEALCENMDLTPDDIDSLFGRAQAAWERGKLMA